MRAWRVACTQEITQWSQPYCDSVEYWEGISKHRRECCAVKRLWMQFGLVVRFIALLVTTLLQIISTQRLVFQPRCSLLFLTTSVISEPSEHTSLQAVGRFTPASYSGMAAGPRYTSPERTAQKTASETSPILAWRHATIVIVLIEKNLIQLLHCCVMHSYQLAMTFLLLHTCSELNWILEKQDVRLWTEINWCLTESSPSISQVE